MYKHIIFAFLAAFLMILLVSASPVYNGMPVKKELKQAKVRRGEMPVRRDDDHFPRPSQQ
jgi:hypothetical protein